MPAFSFEKLPPPAHQEPAPAGPADSASANDPFVHMKIDRVNSPSRPEYARADAIRKRRGFVIQMLGRFTRQRPPQ